MLNFIAVFFIGEILRSFDFVVMHLASTVIQTLPPGVRLIRVMPNMPALVQCGASVFSCGTHTCTEDEVLVKHLFSSIGYCVSLPEKHLDAVTALSGSGPAYVCYTCMACCKIGFF